MKRTHTRTVLKWNLLIGFHLLEYITANIGKIHSRTSTLISLLSWLVH